MKSVRQQHRRQEVDIERLPEKATNAKFRTGMQSVDRERVGNDKNAL
jgi:hypothetical protein